MTESQLISSLYKAEYSKLIAVLCSIFGLSNIEIAEDIASDTFLIATETWKKKGTPENPSAWIYAVAKNKTKDFLKREKIKEDQVNPELKLQDSSYFGEEWDFKESKIEDNMLQMIFAVCHPSLSQESQISLALRILCGFGNDEIASALLTTTETINKRLYRAKKTLAQSQIQLEWPKKEEVQNRLDTVLTTVYLLFNEGYYSASANKNVRRDLCLESMRLALLLAHNESTNFPKVNALLALICFQSSRLLARENGEGESILYENQDRSLWDEELIEKGELYLKRSSTGDQLSKYHLEAAIAFWHSQDGDSEKWENILQLYNYLLQIEYSPIAALNRTYALYRANGQDEALKAALKIDLQDNHLFHCLLAELYQNKNPQKQRAHLERALELCKNKNEIAFIVDRIKNLP